VREFTARGALRQFDDKENVLISMEDNETRELRDDLVLVFCARGWGTSPGLPVIAPKPGHVHLVPKQ
jgi:hypothetical protein